MYPVLSNLIVPSQDDVAGTCALYGQPQNCASSNNVDAGSQTVNQPPTFLQPGDPCTSDDICSSHHCSKELICQAACTADKDCLADQTCVGGACTGGAALGTSCKLALDCLSGMCAVATEAGSLCTRICSQSAPCPSGWECSSVDGQQVCMPPKGREGCACRVHQSSHWQFPPAFVAIGLALLGLARRTRSHRKAEAKS